MLISALVFFLVYRLWNRRLGGACGEDQLPLAYLQRDRQRNGQTPGGGKNHTRSRLVGKKNWTGKILNILYELVA